MLAAWVSLRSVSRRFAGEQRGEGIFSAVLVVGLVATIALAAIMYFSTHQDQVGQTIWDHIKAWFDAAKPR